MKTINQTNSSAVQLTVIVFGIIAVFGILPFLVIWSLNTLFVLSIEYTFANFIAVVFIKYCVFSSVRVTNFNEIKK